MNEPNVPTPYIDPHTGQIVYQVVQHPAGPVVPSIPIRQPTVYPLYPIHYPPPAPFQDPESCPPTTVHEHRRRESKARMAGSFFGLFILSWIPCAFGLPGLTLLAWGLLGAWIFYRACR